jgi:hypothetical protein
MLGFNPLRGFENIKGIDEEIEVRGGNTFRWRRWRKSMFCISYRKHCAAKRSVGAGRAKAVARHAESDGFAGRVIVEVPSTVAADEVQF